MSDILGYFIKKLGKILLNFLVTLKVGSLFGLNKQDSHEEGNKVQSYRHADIIFRNNL